MLQFKLQSQAGYAPATDTLNLYRGAVWIYQGYEVLNLVEGVNEI